MTTNSALQVSVSLTYGREFLCLRWVAEMVTFTCTPEEALCGLWIKGRAVGLGLFHSHTAPTDREIKDAIANEYVDYLRGKPMKCSFESFPAVYPWGYDRDNGPGAMESVARSLDERDQSQKQAGPSQIIAHCVYVHV